MRRTTTLIVGVAATLMMGAGSASAAEIVGSDLSGVGGGAGLIPGVTHTGTVQVPSVNLPLTVSASGVIVEVKIKYAATGNTFATGGFSILTGTSPNFTARTSPLLPNFSWEAKQAGGTRSFAPVADANGLPRGVPIAAGERIAYRAVTGFSPTMLATSPGAQRDLVFADHTTGTLAYTPSPNDEILLQMRVEPDADSDGYGDETQDRCLGVSGLSCSSLCANATKFGTSGNDVITGTAGNDVIAANRGNDIVFGLGGDDVICGGGGNDKIKGGAGKDRLYGEAGRDKLRGGGDTDSCFGGADKDAVGCDKAKQN